MTLFVELVTGGIFAFGVTGIGWLLGFRHIHRE